MKLNYKRTILAGLAFMTISGFWGMYDAVTPLILKNSFHLNEVLNGVVMAMDNVFAIILLPLFGIWSDKTNTKFGKRMPFIAIGTLIAVISMFFMPFADNQRNLILFLISTGAVLLSMSFYRSPAVALMPDITPRELRSKGNAVIISEEEYNAMRETIYITSQKGLLKRIKEGEKEDISSMKVYNPNEEW